MDDSRIVIGGRSKAGGRPREDRRPGADRQRRYDVPVLLDEQGEAVRVLGVRATPTGLPLGREGMLLGRAIRPRAWSERPGLALLTRC